MLECIFKVNLLSIASLVLKIRLYILYKHVYFNCSLLNGAYK